MTFASADLCDANAALLDDGRLAVLPPVFRHFGRHAQFSGRVLTLKLFEDNPLLRATLETPGHGRVLVVDGGASLRCALLGGQLALLAQDNGWAGLVIDGCVRDTDEINQCAIGVRALATHPRRSGRSGGGQTDVRVVIQGVPVNPGDWLYADADGILVARQKLA